MGVECCVKVWGWGWVRCETYHCLVPICGDGRSRVDALRVVCGEGFLLWPGLGVGALVGVGVAVLVAVHGVGALQQLVEGRRGPGRLRYALAGEEPLLRLLVEGLLRGCVGGPGPDHGLLGAGEADGLGGELGAKVWRVGGVVGGLRLCPGVVLVWVKREGASASAPATEGEIVRVHGGRIGGYAGALRARPLSRWVNVVRVLVEVGIRPAGARLLAVRAVLTHFSAAEVLTLGRCARSFSLCHRYIARATAANSTFLSSILQQAIPQVQMVIRLQFVTVHVILLFFSLRCSHVIRNDCDPAQAIVANTPHH